MKCNKHILQPYAQGVISGGSAPAVVRSLGDLSGASYTFTNTAGVALSSYSYNASTDIHTFNVNTIAVANETYSLISGANFTSPKWTSPLTYSNGLPVLAGDAFSFDVIFDNVNVGLARQYLLACAVIQQPTSTIIGNMRPSGVYCITTSVGTPGVGGVADNLAAAATITSMTRGIGTASFVGSSSLIKGGVSFAVTSASSGSSGTRADGNTWSVASSQQLSLAIMLSSNGTVPTSSGAFAMRIKYNVTKLS
jgi:hypothetical protein